MDATFNQMALQLSYSYPQNDGPPIWYGVLRCDLTIPGCSFGAISLPLACKCSPCSARTKLMLPWKKRSGERCTQWISMPRGAEHGPTCTRSECHKTSTIGWLRHRPGYILSNGRLKPPVSSKGQHLDVESYDYSRFQETRE